jgi:hypothetical protein
LFQKLKQLVSTIAVCAALKIKLMVGSILFSYFRHFVPMTKRVFLLIFRKKNYPILNVLNSGAKNKNVQHFLFTELQLTNVLFLKIDNSIYPIFHDNASLKITIPIEEKTQEVELSAIGLFKSKTKKITASSTSKLDVKSILFDRIGQIADKKILTTQPEIIDIKAPLDISHSSAPILSESLEIKEKTYIIKENKYQLNYKQNISVNLDLTELELQLKNQLIHE